MAKGNVFLGYARGSIGDVTFSRVKGQQTSRARNRQPANPRTSKQMIQRSRFMGAVKFYSRGQQNFFTFAFEDKRPNESDYNAFMRANSSKGIFFTKENFDNDFYPSIGNWTMTRGSLNGIQENKVVDQEYQIKLNADAPSTLPTTVGALANHLIKYSAFMAGDIITTLRIYTESVGGSETQPIIVYEDTPTWQVRQFSLDPTSTQPLSDFGLVAKNVNGILVLAYDNFGAGIGGFALVQSRNTQSGLKVSNTDLEMNPEAKTAWGYGTSETWQQLVLADWKAREDAILEGALIP